MQRFRRRTWQRTSKMICDANFLPPGFHIVLLNENGRAKRSDFLLQSGDFSSCSVGFSVGAFLHHTIDENIKGLTYCVDFFGAELRNHKNEAVDSNILLRTVRDMEGVGGLRAKIVEDWEDTICDLESEVKDALDYLEYESECSEDADLLLKAIISHILSQFDIEAVDHVLNFYENMMMKMRRDRKAGITFYNR